MAAIKTICIVLLLVLPLFASACQVSVSQKLTKGKSSKSNAYTVTIRNVGNNAASNVILEASSNIDSVSGMSQDQDNTYDLPNSVQKKGGIPAGQYYTFTYTVKKSQSVSFTATCVDSASATQSATAAPTTAHKATTAPSKAATTAPSKAATTAPSKAATNAPTSKGAATTAPTTKSSNPTSAPNKESTTYQKCPTGTWWQPDPMTTWQWQITGTVDTSVNVQVYDIDLFEATTTLINTLHTQGRFVICYFSTQYEDWRPDSAQFPKALIGKPLDDWAGENYVDSRSPVIRSIMSARLALAASKGCDAVEPDNVDSYQANTGFPLTSADGLDYNMFMSTTAHANGLSVGLKNDLDQVKSLVNYFDWALNEQCNQYSECGDLNAFITAGKAVFNAEYSGSSTTVCPKMNTAKISTLFKTLDLTAEIKAQCCTSAVGGCAPATYTCGGSSSKRSLLEDDFVTEELDVESALNVEDLVQEATAANSAATAAISVSVLIAAVFVALL